MAHEVADLLPAGHARPPPLPTTARPMTGLPTTATLPRSGAAVVAGSGSLPGNGHGGNGHGGNEQRRRLLAQAEELNDHARARAEEGDIEASAQLILQALDCERRAGGMGPQVLQLIKPRG